MHEKAQTQIFSTLWLIKLNSASEIGLNLLTSANVAGKSAAVLSGFHRELMRRQREGKREGIETVGEREFPLTAANSSRARPVPI